MQKNLGLKIFDIFVVILVMFSISMTAIYIYFKAKDKDLFNNSTATYATSVTDPQSGEKMAPLTVSYHENYNNSGKEVVEFRINCYSDYLRTALYTRGFQLIIDEENGNELWYYDSAFGASFPSGHKYDKTNDNGQAQEFFYIDVGEDVWALRLDGSYKKTTTWVDGWKIGRTVGLLGLNLLWEGTNFNNSKTETIYYTFEDLLLCMKDIVKGCSYGVGEYTLPLIDLGDFLHMYEVKNGTVSDNPVGDSTLINSYFSCDVKYDRRGLAYADQSLFKSVANDSNYNVTGIDFDVSYWKKTQTFNISEQDFEKRLSEVENGYYYALSSKFISELKNYNAIDIHIVFDISKLKGVRVLGFDYFALNGIEVKSLTITNTTQTSFNLLVGSIKGTGLNSINVHNVTINNLTGLEVQYEMV